MQNAAQVYGNVALKTSSPRELEAKLLLEAASRLQAAQDAYTGNPLDLDGALQHNRKLWTLLVSSVTKTDNPLPAQIRQNVANLGLFVFKQTMAIMANPKPETLGGLITINRELAAGLLGRG
jgi:flagellar biosynthesis activator protein FlaF